MNPDKIVEQAIATIATASRDKREGMRRNAQAKLEGRDAAWHAAAQRLLDALNAQEESEHRALVAEVADMTPAERVLRAFTAEPMNETEEKLIRVLLDHPGSSSAQLTEHLGWKAQSWHMHFGTMCANRAVYLGPAPDAVTRDGKFYSGVLANWDDTTRTFTMKPDVVAAFAQLGLRIRQP